MAERTDRTAEREERKRAAAEHIGLMKGAFSKETAASAAAALIYEEGTGRDLSLPEPRAEATETLVTTSFAPEAVDRFGAGHVAVVDPASFTRPGGAYEDGAFGPEQILCSASNLYPILKDIAPAYHQKNRGYARGMLFTDRAAFIPDVIFLKGGSIKKADVIAIPEPLRARALENHRSERECDRELAQRVETLLRIAAANEVDTLVVGAFACGRMGYDPNQVTELFKAWIDEHPGAIGKIVFAVPRPFLEAFTERFGSMEAEQKEEIPVPEEEGEEEDEDWRSIDLPEGITIR